MKPRTISDKSTSVTLADSVKESWRSLPTDAGQLYVDIEPEYVINADRTHLKCLFRYLFMSMLKHVDDRVAIRVGLLKNGFVITGDGVAIPADDCEGKFESRLRSLDRYLECELAIVRRIIEASEWEIEILHGVDGGVEFEIHY